MLMLLCWTSCFYALQLAPWRPQWIAVFFYFVVVDEWIPTLTLSKHKTISTLSLARTHATLMKERERIASREISQERERFLSVKRNIFSLIYGVLSSFTDRSAARSWGSIQRNKTLLTANTHSKWAAGRGKVPYLKFQERVLSNNQQTNTPSSMNTISLLKGPRARFHFIHSPKRS